MRARTEAGRVAEWDTGDVLYLAALPRGPITVLEGTAVTIWLAVKEGPVEEVADRVAGAMGLDVDDIRDSVDEFIGRLVDQGLIPRPN